MILPAACAILFSFWSQPNSTGDPIPQVSSGSIVRLENFPSTYVRPRHVDIWLPEGYSPQKKYPVIYMHDGQMLYDSATTWNKQAWNVDDVAAELFRRGVVKEFIIAGIWNSGTTRYQDYFPQKPFEAMTIAERDTVSARLQKAGRSQGDFKPHSDLYLRFITSELKPYIDSTFSVVSGLEGTFIAGSSMGGLISCYAVCEYPEVFGGAACISTHWTGVFTNENNPVPDALLQYLDKNLPPPDVIRFYFDLGDQTIDALYLPTQKRVDDLMEHKGYTPAWWTTRYFAGAAHEESAWNKRLHLPLEFLLAP